MNKPPNSEDAPTFHAVAPALEFACWVVAALAIPLRWINGPAVTDDQFTFQVVLVAVAVAAGASLRVINLRAGRRRLSSRSDQSRQA
ncbi:MAG TPA: hypothetical protein PKC18_03600 [Lacipirellulaceae bacterium]|nr:hypothetical protein [Lacipirellulaceae bacterium]HMP05128.1 hypothetical protein [Lacipirellulaceae bacterium]